MAEIGVAAPGDRIIIELFPGELLEVAELSGSFAALARMYERHYRVENDEAPRLYVTRLETGSVIMEIAPYAIILGALAVMDGGIIVADFTNRLWRGIKAFSSSPGDSPRLELPTHDDAKDIREFARPLLGKSGASLGIKHAKYRKADGEKEIVVEYAFDEAELNRAAINIDRTLQITTIDAPLTATRHEQKYEVMLFLEQARCGPGKEKGRTGDRGVIPDISDKVLPVYFRRSFRNLKGEMTQEVNPLTTTFVVDVNVQYVCGEPKGYIVTEIHKTIMNDELE